MADEDAMASASPSSKLKGVMKQAREKAQALASTGGSYGSSSSSEDLRGGAQQGGSMGRSGGMSGAGGASSGASPGGGGGPSSPGTTRGNVSFNEDESARAQRPTKKGPGILKRLESGTSKFKADMERRRQASQDRVREKRERAQQLQSDPKARRESFMTIEGFSMWPHTSPSLDDVVAAGFYAKPSGVSYDRCKCPFCKVLVSRWKPDDRPGDEHYRAKPSCVFVAQLIAQGVVDPSRVNTSQRRDQDDSSEYADSSHATQRPPARPSRGGEDNYVALPKSTPASSQPAALTPLQKENADLQARVEELRAAIAHEHVMHSDLEVKKKVQSDMLAQLRTQNRALKLQANEKASSVDGGRLMHSTTVGIELLEGANGKVLAGTVEALCEHLLNGDQLMLGSYWDDFLLTFRSFTTWQVVWEMLSTSYAIYCAQNDIQRQTLVLSARMSAIKKKQLAAAEAEDFDAAHRLKSEKEQVIADLEELESRAPETKGDPNDSRWTTRFELEQKDMSNEKIRLRIVTVLKRWLDHHFHDFVGDPALLAQFRRFMDQSRIDVDRKLLGMVLGQAERQIKGENMMMETRKPAPPVVPISYAAMVNQEPPVSFKLNILEFSPLELARQLTLIEWELYKKVAPKELLGLAWSKKDAAARSPQLLKLIDRFNLVSNWMIVMLVREFDLKKRVKLLTHVIKIGHEMYKMGNYNGVFEIVSGLSSSPVDRLKHMWAALSSKKRKIFDTILCPLTHPSKNYETYRGLMNERTTDSPTLPYVGMFLSDLTFIEEGNPAFIKAKDVDDTVTKPDQPDLLMVNFYKCGLVANVIHLVQRFQGVGFVIQVVPFLQTALLKAHTAVVDEKETFSSSLMVEPRET